MPPGLHRGIKGLSPSGRKWIYRQSTTPLSAACAGIVRQNSWRPTIRWQPRNRVNPQIRRELLHIPCGTNGRHLKLGSQNSKSEGTQVSPSIKETPWQLCNWSQTTFHRADASSAWRLRSVPTLFTKSEWTAAPTFRAPPVRPSSLIARRVSSLCVRKSMARWKSDSSANLDGATQFRGFGGPQPLG